MTSEIKQPVYRRQSKWAGCLLVLAFMLFQPDASLAQSCQWTPDNGKVYVTCGNIGIGTTSPNDKLEVVGYVRASGSGGGFLATPRSGGGPHQIWYNPSGTDMRLFNTASGDVFTIQNSGSVGIGTMSPQGKLHVAGDVKVDGNIAAKYQDVAEWVPSSQAIAAGAVVVLDAERSNHVISSSQAYDTRVAGVVSENPGVILGEGGEGKLKVATTGRVRVRVDATRGSIKVGDLLVTSDKEGVAMRSEPVELGGVKLHRPGTIIGKALEPFDKGVGEILVLLSLQ